MLDVVCQSADEDNEWRLLFWEKLKQVYYNVGLLRVEACGLKPHGFATATLLLFIL